MIACRECPAVCLNEATYVDHMLDEHKETNPMVSLVTGDAGDFNITRSGATDIFGAMCLTEF